MDQTSASSTPLEEVAGRASQHAVTAFELLGDETRLAIMLALWEADDPLVEGPPDPTETCAVSFSELRDRVGIRQGAQFNYHLDKLVDEFVHKTADGYELTQAGRVVVRMVVAAAGFEEESLAPTEIDLDCPNCGAGTAVIYQNHRVYHVCTECGGNHAFDDPHPSGVLEGWSSNPAVLSHPSPEAIYRARKTAAIHQYALRVAGICPQCSGQIETRIHGCERHDAGEDEPCPACGRTYKVAAQFVCTVCKNEAIASIIPLLLKVRPPSVAAFYLEHGIELGYNTLHSETASLLQELKKDADQELVSTDPPRVRVTIRHEGDELRLTLDSDLNVINDTKSQTSETVR